MSHEEFEILVQVLLSDINLHCCYLSAHVDLSVIELCFCRILAIALIPFYFVLVDVAVRVGTRGPCSRS